MGLYTDWLTGFGLPPCVLGVITRRRLRECDLSREYELRGGRGG
jgi:hypothetical protein